MILISEATNRHPELIGSLRPFRETLKKMFGINAKQMEEHGFIDRLA